MDEHYMVYDGKHYQQVKNTKLMTLLEVIQNWQKKSYKIEFDDDQYAANALVDDIENFWLPKERTLDYRDGYSMGFDDMLNSLKRRLR